MRRRYLVGILVVLFFSQGSALSQGTSDTTKAALPESRVDSTIGLKQLLTEMRTAAREGNQSRLSTMLRRTEIPNCSTWLHKMYASDKADSWESLCDAKALSVEEASMLELLGRLAKEDGQFLTRSVNHDPQPGRGLEWGWLQALKSPLDIYWASWLPAGEPDQSKAEPIGYFTFIDGDFRWQSDIHVGKVLREQVAISSLSNSTELDQRIEGTTYINGTAHFSLTVPAAWYVTDALVKTTPHVIGTVAARGNEMAIMIQRYPYDVSADVASAGVQSAFSRGFAGYRKLDEPPITIEGERVASFVFRYTMVSGAQSARAGKMLVVFIKEEHSVLGIMCEAPEALFDKTEDTFKKIVTSYRRTDRP